jgi:hypothetical protein
MPQAADTANEVNDPEPVPRRVRALVTPGLPDHSPEHPVHNLSLHRALQRAARVPAVPPVLPARPELLHMPLCSYRWNPAARQHRRRPDDPDRKSLAPPRSPRLLRNPLVPPPAHSS